MRGKRRPARPFDRLLRPVLPAGSGGGAGALRSDLGRHHYRWRRLPRGRSPAVAAPPTPCP